MDIAGWERMYRAGERGKEDDATILLKETVEPLKPGISADLACGTGRNSLYLAGRGWEVTALDGSATAIKVLQQRAASRGLRLHAAVADLTAQDFSLAKNVFDLIVIAYYLQRELFAKAKQSVKPGGLVLAIAHIPDPGEAWTEKRVAPGELRGFFGGWEILHDYEGESRDPAHHRPVAEIVARRLG